MLQTWKRMPWIHTLTYGSSSLEQEKEKEKEEEKEGEKEEEVVRSSKIIISVREIIINQPHYHFIGVALQPERNPNSSSGVCKLLQLVTEMSSESETERN